MKILRLELKGYQRLSPNNVDHVVYTPKASCQLILGTNGSGKSSLLAELSPLPAQSAQYTKGGFKDIEITHRQRHYRLVSRFDGHAKHSFLCDDQELNPGGTGEVQKTLVREHFQLNAELFDILTGVERLTSMSPAERRIWITRLSTIDYSWAITLFKRLWTQARDSQGALKHVRQRLVTETNNLMSLGVDESDERRSVQLASELNTLLSSRIPSIRRSEELEREISSLLEDVRKLSDSTAQILTTEVRYNGHSGMEELTTRLEDDRQQLAVYQGMLSSLSSEYADLETLLSTLDLGDDLSPEHVAASIEEARMQIERLTSHPFEFGELQWSPALLEATEAVNQPISQLFLSLPDNTDRRYSKERKRTIETEIEQRRAEYDRLQARQRKLYQAIEHIESAVESQCPQCGYTWKEGHSPERLAELKAEHEAGEREQDLIRAAIDVASRQLNDQDEIEQLYLQFKGFVLRYPVLQPLWDYIIAHRYHLEQPASHLPVFMHWHQELHRLKLLREFRNRLERLEDVQAKQQGDENLHFTQRMARLADQIATVSGQISQVQSQVAGRDKLRRKLQQVESQCQSLLELKQRYGQLLEQLINALRNEAIDRLTQSHQEQLAVLTRKMTDRKVLGGIVLDLQESEGELDERCRAFKLLADNLSPTEGLIAEQLSGFIGCFTDQLNSIIASIWTKDFSVAPCSNDSGELDYKFPLLFSGADRVPDISKGSKAQQQVVDIAFQLTVMLYLGLSDFPLYLDEPGEGFDEQHRVNLMSFIKQLLETQNHPQLFMISHYASNHGAFTNADVNVLDSTNIAVPGHYNQHLILG